jgi:hypothetical protein
MRKTWMGLASLVLVSCSAALTPRWVDASTLKKADTAFPDAPAVDLYRADRILLYAGRGGSYTQVQHHEAIQVRTEAGKEFADVRVYFGSMGELKDLRGRKTDPDGTTTEIPKEQMLEQPAVADENKGVSIRVFQFPDVKLGSVLEYVSTVEYPMVWNYDAQSIVGRLPTLHYESEFQCSKHVKYAVRAYNMPVQFSQSEDSDVYRVTFSADNLPAHQDEEWAPHPSFDEPWWTYAVKQYVLGPQIDNQLLDWSTAFRPWVNKVYDDEKLYSGFSTRLAASSCGSKACWIDTAVAFVRNETDLTGAGTFNDMRPLKEVVEGRKATGFEKAILLRRLLEDAGVHSMVAAASRSWTQLVDRNFPSLSYWNHLLVFVPPQENIERAIWIDPSCEYCGAGQLPDETRGITAVLLSRSAVLAQIEASFTTTTGTVPAADEERETYEARLEATGRVHVEATDIYHGAAARVERQKRAGWAEAQRRTEAEAYVHRRAPTAQLDAFTVDVCDKLKGECRDSFTFSISGFATPDGDRLIVPLSLLSREREKSLTRETRRRDIVMTHVGQKDETLHLHFPDGYSAVELPQGVSLRADGFQVDFDVQRAPDGLVVHRATLNAVGRFPRNDYSAIRHVVRTYAELRDKVLVLERKAPLIPAAGP